MAKSYTYHPANTGTNYNWENDHTFVKVSTEDTGGAYTLMEDNLKATFALGLHRHDHHAETFYFLEGEVDFYVDGDWLKGTPGTLIHVPPGTPHACRVANNEPAKMLMIYQPSGFDQFLEEMSKMAPEEFEDEKRMAELNEKYDLIPLGPVPEHPNDTE